QLTSVVLDNDNNLQHEINIVQSNEITHKLIDFSIALDKFDKNLLKKFHNKVEKLKHSLCSIYNESFPSITLVVENCRHCYKEKTLPKKFSFDNNMDPGKVPEELQVLTKIEEILRGGQQRYKRNVINFSQDVEEFATRLSRYLSLLNVLIVCQQSERDLSAYNENLYCLPEDDSIVDQLQINQSTDNDSNGENEDIITHTIDWPRIDSNPINEFQTPEYIA
ncbi:26266_t:CDS:2, partial [Gigaspora rosea]